MAHPLYWPGKRYFYPIGNTSAVSLARDVSPDKDISLLLLGCGDPRNVLFTLFCEHKNTTRKLDFTCIDVEPAVLARNILLFSLVIDNKPMDHIFDIFFHFYLEKASLDLLVSQCCSLVTVSASLLTWRTSKYGATLRICNEHTLSEIRKKWQDYAAMHTLPKSKLQSISAGFKSTVADYQKDSKGSYWHTSRSAGPLMMYAIGILSECYRDFWKHGTTFISASRQSTANLLNPAFVYTQVGTRCDVHYGTDPVMPFHLAPIFGNNGVKPSRSDIVKGIRDQFHNWCNAFRGSYEHNQCIIRVLFADAISGTRAIQKYRDLGLLKTRIPVCQWQTSTIILDREELRTAPTIFDVIDTSNLDDHLGLLNVLVAAVPLLTVSGDGVLYLESLLTSQANDETPMDFAKRFHADLSVMSVLFGLCPVDFVTGYSSRGNVHELVAYELLHRQAESIQFHQVTTWKILCSGPLVIDPWQLGTFLYDLYHSLFEEEDALTFWKKHGVNPFQAISKSSIAHYSRESFVLLLQFIWHRLQLSQEEWMAVVDRFMDIQMADSSMKMDTVRYQDFCGLLHLYGVYSVDMYRLSSIPCLGPFVSWPRVPPIVRVFLKVPREKLNVFTQKQAHTPSLEAGMRGPRMHNLFCSIHAAFGTITATGTSANPTVVFEEDPEGFHGSRPLIVSFVMPSTILTGTGPLYDRPDQLRITFNCKNGSSNVMLYMSILGPHLEIHSAPLLDRESVIVIPEQPFPGQGFVKESPTTCVGSIGSQTLLSATFNEESDLLETFSTKIMVDTDLAKSALQSGGEVKLTQLSFNTAQLSLGPMTQAISFPFPITAAKNKLRIARKSLWIEMLVPLRTSFTSEKLDVNVFPVAFPQLFPWSVHHLNLECLPTINLKAQKIEYWIDPHLAASFSKRETKARKKKQTDALMFVKDTIHAIMVQAAGTQPKGSAPQHVFALRDKATNNCDTLVFVDQLRYDLSSHTIVCDGYVLPMNYKRLDEIEPHFAKLVFNSRIVNVLLEPGEMTSWKQLLVVFAERCRNWKHLASCEYNITGQVPLTTRVEAIPLCSCGEGQDVQALLNVPLWKPVAKYCTRIAISPLFAVSYLESVGRLNRSCCVCRAKANKTCPECKKDRYCGQGCQKKDWKRHKLANHNIFGN
ncbi:MYND-type domain-containing protein [Favolaschia claudopus]|uniref:MYND-type domain-containing protein n=1 Tax=Favolaschia claudopus TaxID=2862362 RepID=A0AAW0AL83_9AGAR